MEPINAEELFQIIGEYTVTIRRQNQEIILLQKEISELKEKKK